MRNIISTLILLPLAFCGGCGTVVSHVPDINDSEVPTTGTYRGVRYDAYILAHSGGGYNPEVLAIPDLVVSAVADTVMLPHDLKKPKEDGPTPGPQLARMSPEVPIYYSEETIPRNRMEILKDSGLWAQLAHLTSAWLQNSDRTDSKRFWIQIFTLESVTNTMDGVDVGGNAWVSEDQQNEHQQLYHLVVSLPKNTLRGRKRVISIEKLHVDQAKRSLTLVVSNSVGK